MNKKVFFSGLDCSGKSTQINILKEYFEKKEQKSIVFWSRGGYTPGFQKIKDILRYFIGKKLPKSGNSTQRDKALANPLVIRVWLTIAMLDLFYYYVIYLRIKFLLGYNIICDRYLLDTNIDFTLTYPKTNANKWLLWKLIKIFSLKPDHHFVSTIPVSESIIRSKNKFEPFPDSPETLANRLELYHKELENNESLIFIDGLREMHNIHEEIHDLLINS
jgi:thymidylate kinase